jgi:hypothetical protein
MINYSMIRLQSSSILEVQSGNDSFSTQEKRAFHLKLTETTSSLVNDLSNGAFKRRFEMIQYEYELNDCKTHPLDIINDPVTKVIKLSSEEFVGRIWSYVLLLERLQLPRQECLQLHDPIYQDRP